MPRLDAPRFPLHASRLTRDEVLAALDSVNDPEIPVISVVELGIVADVQVNGDSVRVKLTPTYAGCPAVEVMRREVEDAVRALGVEDVRAALTFDPPWTSDRITAEGRRKLREFGLAPPGPRSGSLDLIQIEIVDCPYCGSADTSLDTPFGPTLCRSIHYCRACKQSFEQFKPL